MVAAQAAMKKAVDTQTILTMRRKTVNQARRKAHKNARIEAYMKAEKEAAALANILPYKGPMKVWRMDEKEYAEDNKYGDESDDEDW